MNKPCLRLSWSLLEQLKNMFERSDKMPLGCKEEFINSQQLNERLTALVGKVTVEKEWLAKKS